MFKSKDQNQMSGRIYYVDARGNFQRIDNVQQLGRAPVPVDPNGRQKIITPPRWGLFYQTDGGLRGMLASFQLEMSAELEVARLLKILHTWDGKPMLVSAAEDLAGARA